MYVCVPTLGTALSVHIPFCWVHWHSNHLQHDSSSGHSASAHAYAKVLLLGHQPRRLQRHHAKGSWWAFWVFLNISQAKLICVFFAVEYDLIWVVVYINCLSSIWTLIRAKLSDLEGKSLGVNQSQSLCAVTSLLSKCLPEMAAAPSHSKWLIPHMEALACQLLGPWPSLEMTVRQTRHINTVIPPGSLVWVLGLWNLGQ